MIATLPFDVTDPITTLALDLSWLSGIDASLFIHSFIHSITKAGMWHDYSCSTLVTA